MPIGLSSLNSQQFDPAELSLTGYWRAPFIDIPPFQSSASGNAGSTLSKVTGTPGIGTALNGIYTPFTTTVASANGLIGDTNHKLNSNNMLSNTAGSGWSLVNSSANDGASGGAFLAFNNSDGQNSSSISIITNTLGTSVSISLIYLGGGQAASATFTRNVWQLVQWYFTPTIVAIRANGNAWVITSFTASTLSYAAGNQQLGIGDGNNTNGSGVGVTGSFLETAITNYAIDQATFDQIRAYCNGRYGISV